MGNRYGKIDYTIRAPYEDDSQEYLQSFDVDTNPKEIKAFYDKYGFVIFNNILTEEEINLSIDDLWNEYGEKVSRHDPTTWEIVKDPHGFVGAQPHDGKQLWNNRQNPKAYKAFKMMYEMISRRKLKEPLISCLARGSIMLPTKGPYGKEEYIIERLPHFDLNPYVWCGMLEQTIDSPYAKEMYGIYPFMIGEGNNTLGHGYPKLRAVLQLSDSTENTGGFECVPGFHRFLANWCRQNPPFPIVQSDFSLKIDKDDPICSNMQKITVRKGSLILFSSELPHTMFPNDSDQFRYAQYLRLQPLSALELTDEMIERRRSMVKQHLPKDLEVSEIGKEVFLLG